jgi:hypothetical protein
MLLSLRIFIPDDVVPTLHDGFLRIKCVSLLTVWRQHGKTARALSSRPGVPV